MPKFQFNSVTIRFNVELQDKIILIQGFSGVGKSAFIDGVERALLLNTGELVSDLPCFVVNTAAELRDMEMQIDQGVLAVFLADEFMAYKVIECAKNKRAYCILVSRKIYKNVNMSYRVLYEARRDNDGITNILPSIRLATKKVDMCDLIIVEDSKSGFDFVSEIVEESIQVQTSKGKSNIKSILSSLKTDKGVLVICDGGGILDCIKGIKREVKKLEKRGVQVYLLMPECFEHVLLCSGFIGYDKDIFKYFSLEYNDTEHFCEERVYHTTKGHPWEYNHSKQILSQCWLEDCAKCDSQCSAFVGRDKHEFVLENGPLRLLLKFRGNK